VPLQGTLDAFSLDEVLEMLAHSRKTGALEVRSEAGANGVLYFAAGRICAAEAGDLSGPVQAPDGLEARLIDVCFVLLRQDAGEFAFQPDQLPPWPVRGGVDVGPILDEVRTLVRDWNAIEAVIPSPNSTPTLLPEPAREPISLDRSSWAVVTAVDGSASVRDIARRLGRSVLEVSRVLKDLVEAGAAAVGAQPASRPVPASERVTSGSTPFEEPAAMVAFDLSELEEAQREAAALAEGELAAPVDAPTISDPSPLAAAAAEAVEAQEASQEAEQDVERAPAAAPPAPSPVPSSESRLGALLRRPEEAAGTESSEPAAEAEAERGPEPEERPDAGEPRERPEDREAEEREAEAPSPRDRGTLLRMFSGLRGS